MDASPRLRRPGLRTFVWALLIAVTGALLGLGINQVSPVGINMKIALNLDEATPDAAPADTTATAGVKP